MPVRCILALAAALLMGCETEYRLETTLHADGSVDRAVYHPLATTPPEAEEPDHWEQTTYTRKIEHKKWTRSIRELPIQDTRPDEDGWFAAWGRFPSPEKIPDHVVFTGVNSNRQARLVRHYERVDYGLVVEHRWEERLTDIIQLAELDEAEDELLLFARQLIEDIVARGFGEAYETEELLTWLREEITPAARKLLALQFAASVPGYAMGEEASWQRLRSIATGFGLELPKTDDDEGFWERDFPAWLGRNVAARLRAEDGSALGDQEQKQIGAVVVAALKDSEEGDEAADNLLCKAWLAVIEEAGGQEAFDRQRLELEQAVFGLHDNPLYNGSPKSWRCSLILPGTVVETTGIIAGTSTVTWAFGDSACYPFGYRMIARSLEPVEAAQQRLLGHTGITRRADLLRFIELAGAEGELVLAVRQAAKSGLFEALRTIQETEAENPEGEERTIGESAVDRLLDFLKARQTDA